MMFYFAGQRGTLQERLEQDRSSGEGDDVRVMEMEEASREEEQTPILRRSTKDRLSTFEVELMDAWMLP